MPVMPMRKRRHMAVFKGVMMAHAPVLTDATTSGGWIGWMPAKMSPATKAAKPLQRMRLDTVTFNILSFHALRLIRPRRGPGCSSPGPRSHYAALNFRRGRMSVRRDAVGLLRAPQNAISIGLGRQGSQRRWVESHHDRPYA